MEVPFMFKKKGTLLFLGLDEAGKSTLMYRLKTGNMGAFSPSWKPSCESLQLGNTTFRAYDVGGHKQARRVWLDYYLATDGVVFIIDGTNRKRFQESNSELQKVLENEELENCPVAVLVNKTDIPQCASVQEIITLFGLYDQVSQQDEESLTKKRALAVFPVSVLREEGYGEAFRWMAKNMK